MALDHMLRCAICTAGFVLSQGAMRSRLGHMAPTLTMRRFFARKAHELMG